MCTQFSNLVMILNIFFLDIPYFYLMAAEKMFLNFFKASIPNFRFKSAFLNLADCNHLIFYKYLLG